MGELLPRAKHLAERTSRLRRLNIGPRLTVCFMLIILAMLAGNAVLVWQFQQARQQAARLAGVDQELIAVLQAHTSLMSFYERLDVLADSQDTALLLKQVETVHKALLQESERSRNVLTRLPPDVPVDPTLLPTLLAIQGELPAQLEAIAMLARSGDWGAIRLRLADQVRPLESRSSALVESIDREVAAQRKQAVLNIRAAQHRIFLIVPVTAAITLLFAAFLGWAITRSITQPLHRLMEGSAAWATGDFSHRVPTTGSDEITRVGSVFNNMIVKLEELYGELLSSEMYLAEAQKLSHTGSFGWDIYSGEIYWSAETFRIFEFEPGANPTVDSILERTHPEDRASLRQVMERASRDRSCLDVEQRLLMLNGSVKYVRVVGRPLTAHGEKCQFVGAVTDITEQKRAEEAARRSQSYLAEAQKLTRSGSWAWNVRTQEVFWSQEMFRIFGYLPETTKLTMSTFLERVHPDDRPALEQRAKVESAQRGGVDSEGDFRIILPDGTIKHLHSIAHPVVNQRGEVIEVVGTTMDVTERKKAEQERERLRQLEADLAHINRVSMLGELAASLAHEIKQPMTAASTNARTCLRWLRRKPPDIDEASVTASRIVEDVSRAADIIDHLRSLYRKDALTERELVDLNEIACEMLVLLRSEANRYSISVRTQLASDLPKIKADRVQLQQVFMNLMLNAIEAMNETGGELTVRSEQTGDDQVLISIRDTGAGLPTDKIDQIFSAFFTTKPQGTGMGLSISRTIIESHGGRLWAAGNEGRGATFHFTLPIVPRCPVTATDSTRSQVHR